MNIAASSLVFNATHWTVILEAARPNSTAGQAAFGRLYSDYWHPLYSYVRRRGFSPEEAEDLIQNFFVRILEKDALCNLKRDGGRFRSFLLAALGNFLANDWDRAHAQKRGAGQAILALDTADQEGRFIALDVPSSETPESLFEKRWVVSLLERVTERLRSEQPVARNNALFEDLKPHLQYDPSGSAYAEIASRHGTSEGAIKVAIYRLRQQYRTILRDEIARTVSSEAEVEEELRHLIRVISD